MGDDAEEVIGVDYVRKSLQCALCLSLLEKPVQTPCQHWFCEDCTQVMWPEKGDCPLCRRPAPIESLSRDHLIRSLVKHVAVRCPNRHMGCHWTGPEDSLPGHERECLVRQLTEVQVNVTELEQGHAQRDMKIAELTEDLNKQMELSLALRKEVDSLKEQSEIDNAIIESLRSLAMSASRRGATRASSTPTKNVSLVEVGVQTLASGSSGHTDTSIVQSMRKISESECAGSKLVLPETNEVSQPQSITQKVVHTDLLTPRECEHWFLQHFCHVWLRLLTPQ